MLRAPLLFIGLLLAPYIHAAEPWRMPVKEWTPQDAARLLADSPWALPVEATMDDPLDRQPGSASALPPGVAEAGLPSNARQGATNRWDGGIAKNRMGRLATIPVTVRWDSAATVRHAMQLTSQAQAAALASAAPANFILSVIGLLPGNQSKEAATIRPKSSSDDAPAARTVEETLEWFMGNSRLLMKGEPPLQPVNVKVDPNTGAVQMFFTRSNEWLARKRDVFFVTRFGSMNVQAKFKIKDMLVDGKPDL